MATETTTPKPEGKKPVANSVLEQLRKLDEQRAQLLDGAKAASLKKIDEGIAELKELGFDYRVSEGGTSTGSSGKKRASSQKPAAERSCEICGITGHDKRAHRNQDPKKKFTAKELAEKGLA